MQRRRKRRIDPDVYARAVELLSSGFGPAAVDRAIRDEFPDRAPSPRTIKALKADLTPMPSDPWRFMEADPEEAGVVLPVLAEVRAETEGRKRTFTQDEADAVYRVRIAVPDIPGWTAYLLARRFIVATPEEADLLVEYMASAPWRHDLRGETEAEAVGLVPHDAATGRKGETDG